MSEDDKDERAIALENATGGAMITLQASKVINRYTGKEPPATMNAVEDPAASPAKNSACRLSPD